MALDLTTTRLFFPPEHVQLQGPLYVQLGDQIALSVITSITETVRFTLTLLRTDGEIVQSVYDVVGTGARTAATLNVPLATGFLLSINATWRVTGPKVGQCYVQIGYLQGTLGVVVITGLAAGYVTRDSDVYWPFRQPRMPLLGPGMIRSIAGTDPAAGSEISETVPTGARWRPLAVVAQLVTSATAATRTVRWIFDDGTNTLFETSSPVTQTASQTVTYVWAALGYPGGTGANFIDCPMPGEVYLMAGYRILTSVLNLQAGDNWGAPRLWIEEWLEF